MPEHNPLVDRNRSSAEPQKSERAAGGRTLHAHDSRIPARDAVVRWLVLATFVVNLNETIMINAIPRLQARVAWVLLANEADLSVLHPPMGARSAPPVAIATERPADTVVRRPDTPWHLLK